MLNLSRVRHNPHGGGNTYELERALGEDMLLTSVGWANSYYQAGETYTDEWGVGWQSVPYETPFGTGHYTEMVGHPLADDGAIRSTSRPTPTGRSSTTRPVDARTVQGRVLDRRRDGDDDLRDGLGAARLRADADGLRRPTPIWPSASWTSPTATTWRRRKRLVEMGVDMIWIGDDVGAQTRHADLARHIGGASSSRAWRPSSPRSRRSTRSSRSPTTPTATSTRSSRS